MKLARWLPLAVLILSASSCAKKDTQPPTRACVLTGQTGATAQCFEYTDARPRAAQETACSQLEVAPGGKKTLVEGVCPPAGRVGACAAGETWKVVCYSDVAGCEKSCRGKFVRE